MVIKAHTQNTLFGFIWTRKVREQKIENGNGGEWKERKVIYT